MMGRLKSDQGQLFYEFCLGAAVPEDHLVRKIDASLDLSWLRGELAPHYSSMGRPSIDPELMIRMLVVGYVFAIRSERLICREVGAQLVQPPPSPNPEAWWRLEDAIVYVNEADRDHKKVPWIKTGDTILGPDQIGRAYSAIRAANKF